MIFVCLMYSMCALRNAPKTIYFKLCIYCTQKIPICSTFLTLQYSFFYSPQHLFYFLFSSTFILFSIFLNIYYFSFFPQHLYFFLFSSTFIHFSSFLNIYLYQPQKCIPLLKNCLRSNTQLLK